MDYNSYLFIIFIWGAYFLNNIYLNYKMRRFWLQKRSEEIFSIPFYIFILAISYKTISFFSAETYEINRTGPALIFKTTGMLFCLAAIALFIYVIYFEKSFPSCLSISQKKSLTGIYKYIRHPSYIVFFLITFGTALYLNDVFLFILAILNHISLNFYYMIEEKRFVKEFPSYQYYLETTRRFLPVFLKKIEKKKYE